MHFTIRPFADDLAGVASLLSLQNPEPLTAEQLQAIHARFPAEGRRQRLVAVTGEGCIAGYASASGFPGDKPGRFWVNLIVPA